MKRGFIGCFASQVEFFAPCKGAQALFAQEAHSGFATCEQALPRRPWSQTPSLRSRGPVQSPSEGFRPSVYPTWKRSTITGLSSVRPNWHLVHIFCQRFLDSGLRPGRQPPSGDAQLFARFRLAARFFSAPAEMLDNGVPFPSCSGNDDAGKSPLSIFPSNMAITMRPFRFSRLQEPNSTRHVGGGMDACSLPIPPPQIRAALSPMTNTATGREEGDVFRQGFRIGASAYRGPFLSRNYKAFLPGEF